MKNIGMDSEKLYQNTVNCIEFPQNPEGACHTPLPSPPHPPPHYIIMQKIIFFCDKMRRNLFIYVNTYTVSNDLKDVLS